MNSFDSFAMESWRIWQDCRSAFFDRKGRVLQGALRTLRNSLACFEAVRGLPGGWHFQAELIFEGIDFLVEDWNWNDEQSWLGLQLQIEDLHNNLGRLLFGQVLEVSTYYEDSYLQALLHRRLISTELSHSEGFETVTWRGVVYKLTKKQSEVVCFLWERASEGNFSYRWGTVADELDLNGESVWHYFRTNPNRCLLIGHEQHQFGLAFAQEIPRKS